MKQLSILIPARNEMFLAKTIEDILENIEADTEIIAVLDGEWADPGVRHHERVVVVYMPESIGQRAATNLAARLSTAKYIMKVDAHCKFDKGFDRKMIEKMKDNYTMVPIMKNLWGFDWVCKNGHRRYQSPSGVCKVCGEKTEREIMWRTEAEKGETARGQWKRKNSPTSSSYCFDSEPHFQYFHEFKEREEYKKQLAEEGLTETMSIQGSCFMVTRERYWALNLSDESFGSWGSQGIEVACKTWLSGGRVIVNRKTWYAHLFRTQGGDFSFPYKQEESQIQAAKATARDMLLNNKFPKQIHPTSWLIKKFWPIPTTIDPKRGIKNRGWTTDDLKNLKEVL